MKKLNRRYVRSIRENLPFYLSATLLTVVTLLMFYMFNIAGNAILSFSADFFPQHHLEDANFTTYLPLSDGDIEELEEKYDLTLEREQFFNLETNGTTARVFKRTEKVDLYEVTVGKDLQADDEILISEGYGVNMDVSIGDPMTIGDKTYKVVGFFQRPDYLYMLENEDDSYKNITTFYLAYMTDSAFDALGDSTCRYLVRYTQDNSTDFRRAVHETFVMRSYLSAKENPRISMVDTQAEMFVLMSYVIVCVLPLIAVALVCIIISRKVKSEQRMIGTLSALGYTKRQLMGHYTGFAALPGIVGGILTAIFSAIFSQPYSEIGLQDYEPMRVQGHLNPLIAVLGVVIPTAMYVIAALLAVRKLLKKDTVLLLAANTDGADKKRKRILADKKLSFRKKYAIRSVIGNPARSFVVLLGIFLGCFIMLFGFSVFDSIQTMMGDVSDELGSYEYQYMLNELVEDAAYGGEKMLAGTVEDASGVTITLLGTEGDNPYLNFRDVHGNELEFGDGYCVSSLLATICDLKEGDSMELYNPLSLEKTEVTIGGIIQNDTMKAVYTTPNNAADILGLKHGVYNALVSEEKLDIPQEKVAKEIRKSSLDEQMQTMLDQMGYMIDLMIGLGIMICIASIYVAINMMVAENRSNISMLKVLGYKDRQIHRIVLDVNHIFLPIGILLAIPAALGLCDTFYRMFADMLDIRITATIAPKSYVIAILLTVASYFASLLLAKRRVKRVDMIESLKDNRE